MQTNPKHLSKASSSRDTHSPVALLRLPQVLAQVPVGRSTLWAWVRDGRFPKPIKLGPMTTAWRASEVAAWIEAQAENHT